MPAHKSTPASRPATSTRRSRKPALPALAAPHLIEPELRYIDAKSFAAYHAAIARGFQEVHHPELLEFDRPIFAHDRFFGFAVGDRWVSSAGAFTRKLTVPGGAEIDCGAVTVVTVQAPFRRRGLLTAMMRHQLQDVAKRREPVAALWASEAAIYGRFGYGPASSRAVLSGVNSRLRFLPGITTHGSVDEVDKERFLAVATGLREVARADRPGWLDRDDTWWEFATFDLEWTRHGASELRYVLHYNATGDADGFAIYRFKEDWEDNSPNGEVRIHELVALDADAHAGLWRYLLDLDLARKFRLRSTAVDEPLRYLVADARAVTTEITDNLYVRIVDVAAALAARRYATDVDVVIEVTDEILPDNAGRYRLQGGRDGAVVTRVTSNPDLTLGILELGTVYLGGPTLRELHQVDRIVEHTAGAVGAAAVAFGWDRAPFCPDNF